MVAGGLGAPRLWPKATSWAPRPPPPRAMMDAVAAALTGIRGAKSQAKVSMRAELARVEVSGPADLVAPRRGRERRPAPQAGKITGDLVFTPTDTDGRELGVSAELAEATPTS